MHSHETNKGKNTVFLMSYDLWWLWGNFLFDFLGHNVKVHIYKSLTMMHILIKASILVGFAPSAPRCLPLTPTPPPHTIFNVP